MQQAPPERQLSDGDYPSLEEMGLERLTRFEKAVLKELSLYRQGADEDKGWLPTGRAFPDTRLDQQKRTAVRRIGRKGYLDERDPHDLWYVVRINYAGTLALNNINYTKENPAARAALR